MSGVGADIKPGNAMPLANIPVGTLVHNVELKPGKGGQMARSAGTYIQLVGRDRGYAILRLTSGEVRLVRAECMASIGAVSNPDQQNIKIGKAGRNRWLGKRPHVRGVVMNPIDHPHGGGEGRTSGGRHPVTPWGKPTKGKRTRSNKKTDRLIVRRRIFLFQYPLSQEFARTFLLQKGRHKIQLICQTGSIYHDQYGLLQKNFLCSSYRYILQGKLLTY